MKKNHLEGKSSRHQLRKGFTLIELLVVIAIISLLSSIVLAALTSARLKAKDAALIEEVKQYSTLLEQNYNDYGNYDNLIPYAYSSPTTALWFSTVASCTNGSLPLTGNYAAQAQAICVNILNTTQPNDGGYAWMAGNPWRDYEFWVTTLFTNPPSHATTYSLSVYLPYANVYYCLGSSGKSSETTPGTFTWNDFFSDPGCAYNP